MFRKRTVASVSLGIAVLGTVAAAAALSGGAPSGPSLSISDVSVSESQGSVTLTITRSAVNSWTFTNFDVRAGSAVQGADYVRTSPSVRFDPGETTKTVTVPLVVDAVAEGTETFTAFIYGTNNVPIGRGSATVTITDTSPASPPSTSSILAPTPPSGPSLSSDLPAFPTSFDIRSLLVPSWGSGAIAPSASPDVVGAFRFICNPAHLAYDDPIVHPNRPGAAHLHQFFGNTGANASSTYESLRTSGESTCNNALNRSAYWLPAMLNGRGQVVRPDYFSIYYKRRPDTDPVCSDPAHPQYMGKCVSLPRGLRYVFGYNLDTNRVDAGGSFHWNCDGAGAVSGHFRSIPEAARGCPNGAQIGAIIHSPPCWDGRNLDSADHRSHMAYASYGSTGVLRCPSTHPFVIPEFTMGAWYTTDATLDRSGNTNPGALTWHLSSDRTHSGAPLHTPGTSLHADWFGAWDDLVLSAWTAHCINRKLNCSGGDLGNGWQLRNFDGFRWRAEPRLVEVPKVPHRS